MGTIFRATLIGGLVGICLSLFPMAAPAQSDRPPPIQVPRYDDADEFLPAAQARNREGIRLVLPQQPGETLFKVLTPRNVTVDVVARYATSDMAAVILLPGGTGVLSIVNDRLDRSFNFQSRSRDHWWTHGFATFLVDAPSDRLGREGISDLRWRSGPDHQADLKAVVDAIAQRFPGPLFVQGHSNGAVSSGAIAGLNDSRIKGYAYSSPAHSGTFVSILSDVTHAAPVVLLQHRDDLCAVSRASDAERFLRNAKAPSKQLLWLEGGVSAMGGPCGAFSAHSFIGVEKRAVDALAVALRKLIR